MNDVNYVVPTANIVAMVLVLAIAVGLPILLLIFWKCGIASSVNYVALLQA